MAETMPAVRVKTLYLKTPRPEPLRYRRSPPFQDGSDMRIKTLQLPPLTKSKSRPHLQPAESWELLNVGRHTTTTPRDKVKKQEIRTFMPLDIMSVRTVRKTVIRPVRRREDAKEAETRAIEALLIPLEAEYPPTYEPLSLKSYSPPPRPASPLELPADRVSKAQGKEGKDWGFVQENA